mmetsp:Transcript_1594/g.3655  ORF Transcript_1594/g.3655 Transcript_1594/m.3655 type:complete len:109 (-) Transcript_1594:82-408(-)
MGEVLAEVGLVEAVPAAALDVGTPDLSGVLQGAGGLDLAEDHPGKGPEEALPGNPEVAEAVDIRTVGAPGNRRRSGKSNSQVRPARRTQTGNDDFPARVPYRVNGTGV